MDLDHESMLHLEKLRKQLSLALERSNIAHMGDNPDGVTVVRIPVIPGRIRKIPHSGEEGAFSVEYKSSQWYDQETGQTRNEKHIIGTILPEYPMAMLPNNNYYRFFDAATGKPVASDAAADQPDSHAVVKGKGRMLSTITENSPEAGL